MRRFKTEKHQVFTLDQLKKSLCPYDDKRFVLSDGIGTRAHGDYRNQVPKTEPQSHLKQDKKRPREDVEEPSPKRLCGDISIPPPPPPAPRSSSYYSYLSSFW